MRGIANADFLTDQGGPAVRTGRLREKNPTGRMAIGNWLGCYRVSTGVGIFGLIGSQEAGW